MYFAFFKLKLIDEHMFSWMSESAVGTSPAEAGSEWTWNCEPRNSMMKVVFQEGCSRNKLLLYWFTPQQPA